MTWTIAEIREFVSHGRMPEEIGNMVVDLLAEVSRLEGERDEAREDLDQERTAVVAYLRAWNVYNGDPTPAYLGAAIERGAHRRPQ